MYSPGTGRFGLGTSFNSGAAKGPVEHISRAMGHWSNGFCVVQPMGCQANGAFVLRMSEIIWCQNNDMAPFFNEYLSFRGITKLLKLYTAENE